MEGANHGNVIVRC